MSRLSVSVEALPDLIIDPHSLWISCHGYESRSTHHLEVLPVGKGGRISCGFDFPSEDHDSDVGRRISTARQQLREAGFETPVTDDAGFEELVGGRLASALGVNGYHVVADISSMSRARIASLLLACSNVASNGVCTLDIVYFPSSYQTHKHDYEPLESFGPCHGQIAGWPDDPRLPLALLVGLGTEPRRADGVLEMVEPAILAVFVPLGDEDNYVTEIRRENRRVLEVGGEPVMYSLRDPRGCYLTLLNAATRLAERSRLVIVPLGPKIFCAASIAAALAIGPEVGVWKASAGRRVQPIDVHAHGAPILMRVVFGPPGHK